MMRKHDLDHSFTDVVKCGEGTEGVATVKAKTADGKKMKGRPTATVRATISFPPEVYETLEVIAQEKKVSIAWVVRDATEQYITDKRPLLSGDR
jgi:hypothetical protein